jgi:hypothetical protein
MEILETGIRTNSCVSMRIRFDEMGKCGVVRNFFPDKNQKKVKQA